MKSVCEKRNKALQKDEKQLRRFSIGDTYFRRDVKQDINLFMSYLRRKIREKNQQIEDDTSLTQVREKKLEIKDYSSLNLYLTSQRNYFKGFRPIKDVTCPDSELPGKTTYNQPGIYNGLQWVLLCFEAALQFDSTTPASTLLSYF